MDRYDSLILEIIKNYKPAVASREKIPLKKIQKSFWQSIEAEPNLSIGQSRLGERITRLYLSGLIENKNGYRLTRKGKQELDIAL